MTNVKYQMNIKCFLHSKKTMMFDFRFDLKFEYARMKKFYFFILHSVYRVIKMEKEALKCIFFVDPLPEVFRICITGVSAPEGLPQIVSLGYWPKNPDCLIV